MEEPKGQGGMGWSYPLAEQAKEAHAEARRCRGFLVFLLLGEALPLFLPLCGSAAPRLCVRLSGGRAYSMRLHAEPQRRRVFRMTISSVGGLLRQRDVSAIAQAELTSHARQANSIGGIG